MQKWEYAVVADYVKRTVTLPGQPESKTKTSLSEVLNQLGAEGWELVASNANLSTLMFILKRPKQ